MDAFFGRAPYSGASFDLDTAQTAIPAGERALLETKRGCPSLPVFESARLAELKQSVGGTHRALWTALQEEAQLLARRQPRSYGVRIQYPGDDEQLWGAKSATLSPLWRCPIS